MGTRFLPATKAIPKEMLPLVDKPVIQYIVEEAVQSGIREIYIVIRDSKRSIQQHFDPNAELESKLKEQGKQEQLQSIRDIGAPACVHYVIQEQPLGLGHAIWCAKPFIGQESFAVLLGDMVIDSRVPCLQQIIEIYNEKKASVIAVDRVEWADTGKYGIIQGTEMGARLTHVTDLIEKPQANPPSNMAIIGRYVLDPAIFAFLEEMKIGAGGEIQLTDALQQLAKAQTLWAYLYEGHLYDVGDAFGFVQANVELGMKNDHWQEKVKQFLQKVHDSDQTRREEWR